MSEPTVGDRLRAGGTIHSDDDNDLMREAADLIDALVEALADLIHDATLLQECIEQSDLDHDTNWLTDTREGIEAARAILARAKGESDG